MPPRCFLALTLPNGLRHALTSVRATLTAVDPGWAGEKWVAAEQLHVTVAFLGDLDDDTLLAALPALKGAAASVPAFELFPERVIPVPSAGRATMLWATLADPRERTAGLRGELAATLPRVLPAGGKPFRPHITLVRARTPRRIRQEALDAASAIVEAAGKVTDGVVSVRSATLFSSTLRASGPEYREIAVLELSR
jgi:2'-5' RNA ligase